MMKNEADVLESFVRHTLTFADEMLIVNHDSTDATGEILAALQAEGLPLQVENLQAASHPQSEVMTALMVRAVAEGADLVLPLDADEFLLPQEPGADCRSLLEKLSPGEVYALEWYDFALKNPGENQQDFILSRECLRSMQPQKLQKIIIGRELASENDVFIVQGNHALGRKFGDSIVSRQAVKLSSLQLAHYPLRSQEQAMSKVACGWVNNVSQFSGWTNRASHWQKRFELLLQGEELSLGLEGEGREYQPLQYAKAQPLKYAHFVGKNYALRNLMATSQLLAEAYRESLCLAEKRLVSVIIAYAGDRTALQSTLQNAAAIAYRPLEFILYDETGSAGQEIQQLAEEYLGEAEWLLTKPTAEMYANLSNVCQGEFIQWLLPGDKIAAKKVLQQVTSLSLQPEIAFVYSNADLTTGLHQELQYEVDIKAGEAKFCWAEGNSLWQMLLSNGILPSGGLAGALFWRKTMEKCHWFEGCFLGNQFLQLSAWGKLLRQNTIGLIRDKMLSRRRQEDEYTDLVMHEIEWFLLLEEYRKQPEILSDAAYKLALAALQERQKYAAPLLQHVIPELQDQYLLICGEIVKANR